MDNYELLISENYEKTKVSEEEIPMVLMTGMVVYIVTMVKDFLSIMVMIVYIILKKEQRLSVMVYFIVTIFSMSIFQMK